jgi:hypothetical protein
VVNARQAAKIARLETRIDLTDLAARLGKLRPLAGLGQSGPAMARSQKKVAKKTALAPLDGYDLLIADVVQVIEDARRATARSVNAVMTATYWLVGRRVVEHEQGGRARAGYGEALLERLSTDLTARFGRGFSRQNLQQMRQFYLLYPPDKIRQTVSGKSPSTTIRQTVSGKSAMALGAAFDGARSFPLPWSHYVRLMSVENANARAFYEAEALRGGWTVRQLNRQIGSLFYERTALSRNKAAMMRKGEVAKPEDAVSEFTFRHEDNSGLHIRFGSTRSAQTL